MGHNNIDRILLAHPPITDVPAQARWCLLLMGKAAHDETQLYWGGLAWLQMQMGYPINAGGRRVIMQHLAALEMHGYISRTDKRKGHRRVYELHLPAQL